MPSDTTPFWQQLASDSDFHADLAAAVETRVELAATAYDLTTPSDSTAETVDAIATALTDGAITALTPMAVRDGTVHASDFNQYDVAFTTVAGDTYDTRVDAITLAGCPITVEDTLSLDGFAATIDQPDDDAYSTLELTPLAVAADTVPTTD